MRYRYIYKYKTGLTKVKTRLAIAFSILGLGAGGIVGSLAIFGAAHAADTTTTVTPTNFSSIFTNNTNNPDSSYSFVSGPATPPAGVGSLEFVTNDVNGHQQHLEGQQQGTSLSSIDAMGYSTYRHSDSTATAGQLPSINMEILADGTSSTYTTLVYEPIYQSGGASAVQTDTWQTWDAFDSGNAVWWSTHAIPGVCASSCYVSWSTIVSSNPAAVMLDYGVNQGSGNSGLTANVDALSIGVSGDTTTYDFEPYVVATDKSSCKNGGYQNVTDNNGNSFRNQGQCVSWTEHFVNGHGMQALSRPSH